jgi:DUF4097 and DUF4098 domain-containing protein YvlB
LRLDINSVIVSAAAWLLIVIASTLLHCIKEANITEKIFLVLIFFLFSSIAFGNQGVNRQFPVKIGGTVEFHLETGGSVRVESWDKELLQVQVRFEGRDDQYSQVDFTETSSGISIRSRFNGPQMRIFSSNLQFEIKLPSKFNIALDSIGGGLIVHHLEGSIKGKTGGGNLDLRNLKGTIQLTTHGGDVTLKDSEVDGKITTWSGQVLFENVRGDIKGSSESDEVILRNVERVSRRKETVGDEIRIKRVGGDINVPDARRGAWVETLGGNIRIGAGRRFVHATTNGGDITIESVDGWVKARTYGGNITVNVIEPVEDTEAQREIEITSHSGDLRVVLPQNFPAIFEIELAYTIHSNRNYEIISDFDLNQEETKQWDYSRGTARRYILGSGSIGSGKHRIKLNTINGNIYLKERN